MSENLSNYKHGAPRKIQKQLGRWYLLMLNIKYQRWFNGLPPSESKIIVLDDQVNKNAENAVDGYEYVFEVFAAPEFDLVLDEGQNNLIKVPPVAKVGDIVLVKGNVMKLHTEPVMFASSRDNIVALVMPAEERPEYGGKSLEERE